MTLDLTQFSGTLPYASELFGVYQPLIGWKSRRKQAYLSKEVLQLVQNVTDEISRLGPSLSEIRNHPGLVMPDSLPPRALPSPLNTMGTRKLINAVATFRHQRDRLPSTNDWATIIKEVDLASVVSSTALPAPKRADIGNSRYTAKQEAVMGGIWQTISAKKPGLMESVLQTITPDMTSAVLAAVDPLGVFPLDIQAVALSPLGFMCLYREYFFEFPTFLGPPVGHVWVSPGGSLELYEVHTRRTLEERQTEIANEITTKSQTEASEEDELSTSVHEQNARNLSFGATVSASGKIAGVVQVGASTNFGMQFNHQTAEESAHKHARKQSESLSNEIRRSFKTTFKTSVETTDTSSRRYVLSNTTDALVNYELRRKMRQVGVQVQHIATRLCWETYVDWPSFGLGLANLVHVAVPEDLQAPDPNEKPARLPSKSSQYVAGFPFEGTDEARDENDAVYVKGVNENGADEGTITWHRYFHADPPPNATGYTLVGAVVSSFAGTDPNHDQPSTVVTHCMRHDDTTFELFLDQVNFEEQPQINFTVDVTWASPPISQEAMDAYEKKEAAYNRAAQEAVHAAFVKEVRERVTLASNIRQRSESDLREEERTLIFRRLLTALNLASSESTMEPLHVQSELLRAIFEIDKMLYFVEPEWWKPRGLISSSHQSVGDVTKLTDDDRVTWGRSVYGPDYLITEDAQPAPLGASLGWMLQLDGDAHRNAFLNSAWVKAVIPIRPGREQAAMDWLTQAHVEGSDNLTPELKGELLDLGNEVAGIGTDMKNELATETVFQTGFDPLEGGFQATGKPFEVFDQWIEILPTEQIVAIDYHPKV